ncbi:MAG: tetratricopeptide repeat protein [Candidatus Omnitrophota bacterium]
MRKKWIYLLALIICSIAFVSCGKIKSSFKHLVAEAAYNQGKYDKAIGLYKEIVADNPSNAQLRWNLGIAYYSKGDLLNASRQAVELRKLGRKDLAQDLEQVIERQK